MKTDKVLLLCLLLSVSQIYSHRKHNFNYSIPLISTITALSISIQCEAFLTAAVEVTHSVCAALLAVVHTFRPTLINVCLVREIVKQPC